MRIGVIGLGRIGSLHAQNLAALDTVDELVITDAIPAAIDAAAKRLGALPAGTVDELLDSGIDGVVIASPTSTHLDLLRRAVSAGIPAFCEKPLALDPFAAADLPKLVEHSGVPVQVGLPRRFDPAFVAAKAELDAGRLGWLTTVRSTTMDPAPPPAAYLATSGGIFRDCAIHDLDAVRWVTGREVVEVYALGADHANPMFVEIEDADSASVLLTLDDGTIGVVSNTRYNGEGYDVRLELHGSAGSIAAGLDDHLPMRSADPGAAFPAGPAHTFFMDRFLAAFHSELAAFVDVVAGRRPSPCTVTDGLEASWVAEACTRSYREHRPVRLDEFGTGR